MKFDTIAVLVLSTSTAFGAGQDLKQLDAKSMFPGYCLAGSRADDKAIGGYQKSDNLPKKLGDKPYGKVGKISLAALPTESVPFGVHYRGFKLVLVNRTKNEASFSASDSRLPIRCEARDWSGRWKEIEYLPLSFCGNSLHHVYLPSGHYWEFAAPSYSGTFRTKLRFKLQDKETVYSNVFDGGIDPKQFDPPQTDTKP